MSRRIPLLVIALTVSLAPSCRSRDGESAGTSHDGPNAGSYDKQALLRSFGECALGGYREFQAAAAELSAAAQRAETEATPAARADAQNAWKKATNVWQRMEVFQFGPAAMTGSPGGKDMRDPIYAWPLVSSCLIDQAIVSKAYEKPDFSSASLVSTRSLAAIEYLLFYDKPENTCPASANMNAQGQWAALGTPEVQKRRLGYARVVAAEVAQQSQTLVDAWDPAKGNFLEQIGAPGAGKAFASQQQAFNAVSDAMFYLDDQLKNMKVGRPAGLTVDCASGPCLDTVESIWAKTSKENMRRNLEGYDQLLRGCGANGEGQGFDDLLVAVGAEPVAKKLDETVVNIRNALDALKEPTYEEDIQKNPAGVKALFDALRANGAAMKSEFVTVLDLELPKRVEGDND